MIHFNPHPRVLSGALVLVTALLFVFALMAPSPGIPPCRVPDCPLRSLHTSQAPLTDSAIAAADSLYTCYLFALPPSTLRFCRAEIEHFELVRESVIAPLLLARSPRPPSTAQDALRSLDLLIRASYLRTLPASALAYAVSQRSLDPTLVSSRQSRAALQTLLISEQLEPTAIYLAPPDSLRLNHARVIATLAAIARALPSCYTASATCCLARVDSARGYLSLDPLSHSPEPTIRYLLSTDSMLVSAGLRAITALPSLSPAPPTPASPDPIFLGRGVWLDPNSPALSSRDANLILNYLNNRLDGLTLMLVIYRLHLQCGGRPLPLVPASLHALQVRDLFHALSCASSATTYSVPPDVQLFALITRAEFAQATADLHFQLHLAPVAHTYDSLSTAALMNIAIALQHCDSPAQRDRIVSYLSHSPALSNRLGHDAPSVAKTMEDFDDH